MNKKAISNVLASTFLLLVLGVGIYSVTASSSFDQHRQTSQALCMYTAAAAPGYGQTYTGICEEGAGAINCPGTSGTCTAGAQVCCTLAGGSKYQVCQADGTWGSIQSCLSSQVCSFEGPGGYCTPANPPQ